MRHAARKDTSCLSIASGANVEEPALKPAKVTIEQAASTPASGTIALNNLHGGGMETRQHVIALHISKADGAQVTAVRGQLTKA